MEIYKESGYTERDAAAMIVQNNLFGLDIDDRASQLAYFAVMMKARSYDRRFLSRGIKPNVLAIKESNGMGAVVRDGLTTDAKMNEISRYLVDTFRDAKELGSIITVEPKDYDGYMAYLDNCDGEGQLTMDDADWLQNTRPMLKALARQAKVLATKYPVVCTNPPYLNKIEGRLKTFVTENYKDYSGDLFSVFIYRNLMFCKQDGYCGYMTPFVWMFIKTYEKLREFIIQSKSITTLVQMEYSAFEEATVPICSFVLKNGKETEKGLYFKLSDFKGGMDVQKQKVLEALADKNCGYFYEADQCNFTKIPKKRLGYWISDKMIDQFSKKSVSDYADTRRGLQTGNSERFIRKWYEVSTTNAALQIDDKTTQQTAKWFLFNSGGAFRRWYGNIIDVVNWENNGREIKSTGKAIVPSEERYFDELVSWNKISSGQMSVRYQPNGIIPGDASPFLHSLAQDHEIILYVMAMLNSKIAAAIVEILSPTLNFEVGNIAEIPVAIDAETREVVIPIVDACVRLARNEWNDYETSWDFKRNPLV